MQIKAGSRSRCCASMNKTCEWLTRMAHRTFFKAKALIFKEMVGGAGIEPATPAM
jgi:hypothetical protein